MLIVTMGAGDRLVIETPEGPITVMYVQQRGVNEHRVGVDAPKQFPIGRGGVKDWQRQRAKQARSEHGQEESQEVGDA